MSKIKTIIGLLFLVSFSLCGNESGLRGAINDSTVASFIKYISPEIIKQVSSIQIPDQSFTVKASAFKIKITLSDIHISITNFSPEIVNVDFASPDIVQVTITNLKAKGGFRGKFKWAFISDTERVDFDFKSVNINMKLKISTRDVSGKKLPNATFELFDLNFDFDFTLHGTLGKILSIVKGPIKKAIGGAVNKIVKSQSGDLLKKAVELIPPYVSINNKGYAVDYTFISSPEIKDSFLLFNSYGAFVNTNNPDTMKQHFPLSTNVPEYNPSGKQVQLYVSDFVINTAFYTLYHTNSLNITVKPEVVPESVPVKLNTNWLAALIVGIDQTFGKNVPCEIGLAVRDSPAINFTEKYINLKLPSEIIVNARVNETNTTLNYILQQVVKINTDFIVDIDFHIMEEGNITAYIHELKMNSTSLVESAVPTADAKVVETGFNMIASMVIPSLNNYLAKFLNITIPSVKGIKFDDMTVNHNVNYMAVEYNLTYENVTTVRSKVFEFGDGVEINNASACPEGKMLKKMKLKKDKVTGKMYYKIQCANRKYYAKKKKEYICPNEKH